MSAIKQPPVNSGDNLTSLAALEERKCLFLNSFRKKGLELTLSGSSWVMCLSLNQSLWQNGRDVLTSQVWVYGRSQSYPNHKVCVGGWTFPVENQIINTRKRCWGRAGECLLLALFARASKGCWERNSALNSIDSWTQDNWPWTDELKQRVTLTKHTAQKRTWPARGPCGGYTQEQSEPAAAVGGGLYSKREGEVTPGFLGRKWLACLNDFSGWQGVGIG